MFAELLKERLAAKGVNVAGRGIAINSKNMIPAGSTVEVAKVESPPLALIAAKTMKPSQNMYTETLLWTLGEEIGRKSALPDDKRAMNADSSELGRSVVRDFLKSIGVAEDAVLQSDATLSKNPRTLLAICA